LIFGEVRIGKGRGSDEVRIRKFKFELENAESTLGESLKDEKVLMTFLKNKTKKQ